MSGGKENSFSKVVNVLSDKDIPTELADQVGLSDCGWHALRHTCAAMLIDGGAHPKVVQQQMRHSTISMTLDTYGHLFPARQDEAVSALDGALGLGRAI